MLRLKTWNPFSFLFQTQPSWDHSSHYLGLQILHGLSTQTQASSLPTFTHLGIRPSLVNSLTQLEGNILSPTPLQQTLLPFLNTWFSVPSPTTTTPFKHTTTTTATTTTSSSSSSSLNTTKHSLSSQFNSLLIRDHPGSGKTWGLTLGLLNVPSNLTSEDLQYVQHQATLHSNWFACSHLFIVPHVDLVKQIHTWVRTWLPTSTFPDISSILLPLHKQPSLNSSSSLLNVSMQRIHGYFKCIVTTPTAFLLALSHRHFDPRFLQCVVLDEIDAMSPPISKFDTQALSIRKRHPKELDLLLSQVGYTQLHRPTKLKLIACSATLSNLVKRHMEKKHWVHASSTYVVKMSSSSSISSSTERSSSTSSLRHSAVCFDESKHPPYFTSTLEPQPPTQQQGTVNVMSLEVARKKLQQDLEDAKALKEYQRRMQVDVSDEQRKNGTGSRGSSHLHLAPTPTSSSSSSSSSSSHSHQARSHPSSLLDPGLPSSQTFHTMLQWIVKYCRSQNVHHALIVPWGQVSLNKVTLALNTLHHVHASVYTLPTPTLSSSSSSSFVHPPSPPLSHLSSSSSSLSPLHFTVLSPHAMRGLTVPGHTHVFSVGLPTSFNEYLHMAGRVGRPPPGPPPPPSLSSTSSSTGCMHSGTVVSCLPMSAVLRFHRWVQLAGLQMAPVSGDEPEDGGSL
ncbi:hypothetical protein HMI54_002516 [Coelomomyces lativittatus]|nr:hypothetical protein HMI56_007571 [Coelomomyces lativittatus]KAJ1509237.1 hypothetical protein HMI54_002516 [Coelomomyces lativittatus]KAJ1516753.1 hypothetical protein HMI55_001505 [Coelomomyces lativittatus]